MDYRSVTNIERGLFLSLVDALEKEGHLKGGRKPIVRLLKKYPQLSTGVARDFSVSPLSIGNCGVGVLSLINDRSTRSLCLDMTGLSPEERLGTISALNAPSQGTSSQSTGWTPNSCLLWKSLLFTSRGKERWCAIFPRFITLASQIAPPEKDELHKLGIIPKNSERTVDMFKPLAEELDDGSKSCYILSDRTYGSSGSLDNNSTRGFAEYLKSSGYGKLISSPVMINPVHQSEMDFTLIQCWIWVPPKSENFCIRTPALRTPEIFQQFRSPDEFLHPDSTTAKPWWKMHAKKAIEVDKSV